MDTVSVLGLIGVTPFFFYILLLTFVHWRGCPTVFDGRTDALLLAFGLSGYVMTKIAPAVIPFQALRNYGSFAWVLLFFLYIFLVFFLSSTFSRKIIIYNLDVQRVRRILQNRFPAEPQSSESPRFSGRILEIPSRSVTAWLGSFRRQRYGAVLTFLEPFPSQKEWRSFLREFREVLSAERVSPPSRTAWIMTGLCIALLGIIISMF